MMLRRSRRVEPESHKTSEVFGIQRDVPENYITRDDVDNVFVNSLTESKHIVIYGSSKQGKTSLRKYNLRADEYITITCSNTTTLSHLQSAILKEAGYTVEQSSTRTISGESKINAHIRGGINIGVARIGSDVGGEITSADGTAITEIALELDPSDTNDIIRALRDISFEKFIVIEDFHYLPIKTQEEFSFALKAFHENSSLTFIIVGVWLDENRLVQYNGDLTGRVLAVDADRWSAEQLREVIAKGEELLNIRINSDTAEAIVTSCFESVYIVQSACYQVCVDAGVYSTAAEPKEIGAGADVTSIVQSIVNEQSARYEAFLNAFSEGFQETQLEMYRWLLLPILAASSTQLEAGLSWSTVKRLIDEHHPASPINAGSLIQALKYVSSLQTTKKINPIIIDYDQTKKRLNVVDRGFLIWLNYQDRTSVREQIGLPGALRGDDQPSMLPEA